MRSRLWKRISAGCLTAMVAVSMLGMSVSATSTDTDTTEEEEDVQTSVEVDTITTDDGTYINLSKIVTTDGDTYEPVESFEFVLTEMSGVTSDDNDGSLDWSDADAAETLSGVLSLVADTYDSDDDGTDDASRSSVSDDGTTGTITFVPGDVGDGDTYTYYEIYGYVSSSTTVGDASKDGGLYLLVDTNSATSGTTYYYTLTETTGSYEGIVYDTTTYYLAVTIGTDDSENTTVSVVAWKDSVSDSAKVGSLVFDNSYGVEGSGDYPDNPNPYDPEDPDNPDDPFDTTHDIEIFKDVEGDGADEGELFDFYVSVVDNGTNTGEWYKVVYRETSTSTDVVTHVVAGETIRIQIGATGSIQVYGLTRTDEVIIYEADYSATGYTTTVSNIYVGNVDQGDSTENYETDEDGNTVKDDDGNSITVSYTATAEDGSTFTVTDHTSNSETSGVDGTLKEDGINFTVTNERAANVITGVVMTVGPYIALIAAAVVLLLVVSRRRRKVEY